MQYLISGIRPSNIMTEGIATRGYWLSLTTQHHCYDASLAEQLAGLFRGCTVVDLGCGPGQYVRCFDHHGIACEGYDGNPNTPTISGHRCQVADLTCSLDLPRTYDWVLSLEVAEHIPSQYETTFIENLDRHNSLGIVLSWATPRQGGFGHVNERENADIKKIFADLGYTNDLGDERRLRAASRLKWFKNTLMVFRR